MIKKGNRVRHRDKKVDNIKGIMTAFEIKNGFAFCAYGDFERYGQGAENYPITELELAE
ncbi:hypothetical protein [Zunongwangia pacifica]|uniref:Phage protein n=1 Tax=Zunongwangia pacifica TaxID=2911062 RepID=A0A9X2CND4_9FLAO|nr:hypothetical protein [Zunongwangia pacifica]MCL6220425.1 hypothetical protein [Zunongwangia pacifica]